MTKSDSLGLELERQARTLGGLLWRNRQLLIDLDLLRSALRLLGDLSNLTIQCCPSLAGPLGEYQGERVITASRVSEDVRRWSRPPSLTLADPSQASSFRKEAIFEDDGDEIL